MIPKLKPYRNAAYLRFVRSRGCLVCGQPSEAHHVRRSYWGAGLSQKPHDYVAIPLCREHHGPETEKFINVEKEIIELLMAWIVGDKPTSL